MSVVTISLRAEEWLALLGALPRCQGCGQPAEITLREPGASYVVCCACAAQRPEGSSSGLGHGAALGAIESALLAEAGI